MSKFKKFFRDLIITKNTENSGISSRDKIKAVHEVEHQNEAHKKVAAIFEQQAAQMGARAFIAHEMGCDEFTCTKNPCWKWEPDKIVSEVYKVHKNTGKRI